MGGMQAVVIFGFIENRRCFVSKFKDASWDKINFRLNHGIEGVSVGASYLTASRMMHWACWAVEDGCRVSLGD